MLAAPDTWSRVVEGEKYIEGCLMDVSDVTLLMGLLGCHLTLGN